MINYWIFFCCCLGKTFYQALLVRQLLPRVLTGQQFWRNGSKGALYIDVFTIWEEHKILEPYTNRMSIYIIRLYKVMCRSNISITSTFNLLILALQDACDDIYKQNVNIYCRALKGHVWKQYFKTSSFNLLMLALQDACDDIYKQNVNIYCQALKGHVQKQYFNNTHLQFVNVGTLGCM